MKSLDFFDCNALYGRRTVRDPKEPFALKELLRDMDYFGIRDALVRHASSKEYHPREGNEILARETARRKRLYPCFAFLPGATREQGDLAEAIETAVSTGPTAACVWPKSQNFSLSEWCCGDLIRLLELRKVPLLIDFSESSLGTIAAVCQAHPRLPVIATGISYRTTRELYAIWQRSENLHIDISMWSVHGGLEEVCERFGAGRLLFGTKWPFHTPGVSITHITYSGVSAEEKRLIAGENLRRLLREVVL